MRARRFAFLPWWFSAALGAAFAASRNPFQVLGLGTNAGDDDVKPAFRRLAKVYHPDVPETGNEDVFRRLSWAAEELSTEEGRRQWRVVAAGAKPPLENLMNVDKEAPEYRTQGEAPFGEYESLEDDVFDLRSAPKRSKKRKNSFADSRARRAKWRFWARAVGGSGSPVAKIKAKRQKEPEPPGYSKDRNRYKRKVKGRSRDFQ
mmetsp:Transcript_11457/g.27485  ORF Transcript_11457/g.27485 Transcript_11457/m.27485 type:complete len:204 (+) Transcript_11457:51-662(+)